MPSSGAFSVLRLRAPRLNRDESSVTTKNSKLHESIRIQALVYRLELRLQTRDLRAHLAPELNLHVLRVLSTCFSLFSACYQGVSGRIGAAAPLQPRLDPAELRFPAKLGWSPGDLRRVNAVV